MQLMDIDGEFTRGKAKYSGGARELGIEGLDEFRETKHVPLVFKLEDKSYWYLHGR